MEKALRNPESHVEQAAAETHHRKAQVEDHLVGDQPEPSKRRQESQSELRFRRWGPRAGLTCTACKFQWARRVLKPLSPVVGPTRKRSEARQGGDLPPSLAHPNLDLEGWTHPHVGETCGHPGSHAPEDYKVSACAWPSPLFMGGHDSPRLHGWGTPRRTGVAPPGSSTRRIR